MERVKIGVLGTGAISGLYFQNLTELFREVEVWAVCDLFREKAAEAGEKYGIPRVYDTMEEMLEDRDYILKKLEISEKQWNKIMQAPNKTEDDYASYKKLIVFLVKVKRLLQICKGRVKA